MPTQDEALRQFMVRSLGQRARDPDQSKELVASIYEARDMFHQGGVFRDMTLTNELVEWVQEHMTQKGHAVTLSTIRSMGELIRYTERWLIDPVWQKEKIEGGQIVNQQYASMRLARQLYQEKIFTMKDLIQKENLLRENENEASETEQETSPTQKNEDPLSVLNAVFGQLNAQIEELKSNNSRLLDENQKLETQNSTLKVEIAALEQKIVELEARPLLSKDILLEETKDRFPFLHQALSTMG